jgi:hypothetical protein
MGDAHVFGLGAVDAITQDPTARRAMRILVSPAILTTAAGGGAGDKDVVAGVKHCHAGAGLLDDPDTLVTENEPWRAGWLLRICKSVPQIVVLAIFTMASVRA